MTNPSTADVLPTAHDGTRLDHAKHVVYWKRCLKTYLPRPYTSTDALRISLAYFIISALDLLGALETSTTPEERAGYADWIYSLQLPDGGFRGAPATDLGQLRSESNQDYDPAHVPSTYFALSTLLILRDDLERVKRPECLRWLAQMQRDDGSFGAHFFNGQRVGGTDTRLGYSAMVVRWMLRGRASGSVDGVPDLNIPKFVQSVRHANTYDGGIAEMAFHEAHGGFTYCAISALYLASPFPGQVEFSGHILREALTDFDQTLQWLVNRQTIDFDDDDDEETDDAEKQTIDTFPDPSELPWIGMNGRTNKLADTCYSWWGTGTLAVLGRLDLLNVESNIRFLLDRTQHAIGGFGKAEGDPPDIYHSYLGLAALSAMKYEGLKPIYPAACFSYDTVEHLRSLSWRKKIWDAPEPLST